MSQEKVEKARAACRRHIDRDGRKDGSARIMCSLLSDPEDIKLVTEVAQLAVSAWCCALREAQVGTIGMNWNFEQVSIVIFACISFILIVCDLVDTSAQGFYGCVLSNA